MKPLKLVLSLLILSLAACTPPYRQTFLDAGKEKGWTEKQTLAAFSYADRIFWGHDMGEGRYVILYGKVPTSKVETQLQEALKDFDQALDPTNEENRQYLDAFNLRKDFEHDEKVTEVIYSRVHASRLYNDFQEDLGEVESSGPEAEMRKGYNLRKIFLAKNLASSFPFTSEEVEGAKKDGKLKQVETAEYSFHKQYDHKDIDPNHPADTSEFIWKPRTLSLSLVCYKIIDEDKPSDNKGSYIEGYRVVNGNKESKPALKIFFPSNGFFSNHTSGPG
jgi:hypothetical protein